MKVNFNRNFKDAFGKEAQENGKAVSMRDLVAQILFGGGFLERTGKSDDATKLAAYRLSVKLATADEAIDITAEEAVLIKQATAATLTPGTYGQIYDLLEG